MPFTVKHPQRSTDESFEDTKEINESPLRHSNDGYPHLLFGVLVSQNSTVIHACTIRKVDHGLFKNRQMI